MPTAEGADGAHGLARVAVASAHRPPDGRVQGPATKRFHLPALVLVLGSAGAAAADIEVGPADDWRGAIAALQPGDTLSMRAGTYPLSAFFVINRVGTAAQPITIRAVPGARPSIVQSGTQNVINIQSASHLVLQGLEISGGAADGVRVTSGSDITLRDLLIRDVPGTGVSANVTGSTVTRLTIESVEIRRAARGIDLGCNSDACRAVGAVVRRNWIHETLDPTPALAYSIRIQTGSQGALVEDNVVHDVGIGLSVLSTLGNGNPHRVQRNVVLASRDFGVQLVGHTVFENNIVLGSPALAAPAALNVSDSQGVATALAIVNNTLVAPGASVALRIRNVVGATTVANNALFSESGNAISVLGSTGISFDGNAGQGSLVGTSAGFAAVGGPAVVLAGANYSGTVPQDLLPAAGGPLVGTAIGALAPAQDFDALPRDAASDVGALERGGDPLDRWIPALGFKRTARVFRDGFEPL